MCDQCQRPLNVCICECLVSLKAPCNIVILQHPSEQKQPLATVPILKLCLSNLKVIVGEELGQHPDVQDLIAAPDGVAVIYPGRNAEQWDLKIPFLNSELADIPKTLIVLDGTWRKAKLLWFNNPWLQSFRIVALKGIPESEYLVRSSKIEGGVSTLEAVMHSCNFISQSNHYDELMNPFKAMVDWQIKKMGKEIFYAHYMNKDE